MLDVVRRLLDKINVLLGVNEPGVVGGRVRKERIGRRVRWVASGCYALGGYVVNLANKSATELRARCALFDKILLELCIKRISVCLESKSLVARTSPFASTSQRVPMRYLTYL